MEKYERFTDRNESVGRIINCNLCIKKQRTGCCELTECIEELADHLAELEDKLEAGTLVELPCKVGDTVYEVIDVIGKIDSWEVTRIDIYAEGIICILGRNRTDAYNVARGGEFGKRWFTTREAAEARLAELKRRLVCSRLQNRQVGLGGSINQK